MGTTCRASIAKGTKYAAPVSSVLSLARNFRLRQTGRRKGPIYARGTTPEFELGEDHEVEGVVTTGDQRDDRKAIEAAVA